MKYYHDDLNSVKKLFNLTEEYAKRITWHLYRIYRARNDIAHHGNTPNDLKDLGEHLHTYVDTVATEIMTMLADSSLKTFADVLMQSSFLHEKISKLFRDSSTSLDSDLIKVITEPNSLLKYSEIPR